MDKECGMQLIEEILNSLTLKEKIGMVHGAGLFRTEGVPRLGIPPLKMSDGPMGVRAEFANDEWRSVGNNDDFVTYLPCNSAIASTWDLGAAHEAGAVLGEETRGRGKDVILAPGVNIKRSPLCGRNFEYVSEDPYLTAQLAVQLVDGIQQNDVAACVKHFAANSQETERLWVDTVVDEKTLQEIYYPAFRETVKAGAFSVMGAYNKLNGEHCCTGSHLLNEVLRGEWGFDGAVISDWGGVHDTEEAARSGLDIEMDVVYDFEGHHMAAALEKKILDGEIEESCLDEKVRNILRLMLRLKMIGAQKESRRSGSYNTPGHREAALEVAREAVVLLKNENGLLPLSGTARSVAVIGRNAAVTHSNGGGSAEIKALYEITPLMGIKKLLGGNCEVSYAPGYVTPEEKQASEVNWQADSTKHLEEQKQPVQAHELTEAQKRQAEEQKKRSYREQAIALAQSSDVVIFVGGLNHDYDCEGKDRADMRLPYGQDELLEALLQVRPDTVIALVGGSPVEMPWLERAQGVVWSYYNGMEGGTALAEVLFGIVNPSGKLAETFPKTADDCPAHTIGDFGLKERVEYREKCLVGYRYYDAVCCPVNFCFGHGLSYTEFVYEGLKLKRTETADGGEWELRVQVRNSGRRSGAEIVQLYAAPVQAADTQKPVHELKGFARLALEAGETAEAVFCLKESDLSHYSEEEKRFVLSPGEYELQIGASSRDIRLTERISVPEAQ